MTLDRARLGTVASEQMQVLEEAYGDETDAEIFSAITIVEIVENHGETRQRDVRIRFDTDGDVLRLVAVLRSAEMQILAGLSPRGE